MAKTLQDMAWLVGRPQATAMVEVSDPLGEVTAFRQDGGLTRAQPEIDVIVKMVDRFYVYPAATAAVSFTG